MKYSILYIFLTFSLFNCSSETLEPDTNRVGFDYFPLYVGDTIVYDVDEINFDILGSVDTSKYLLMTVVADSFLSQSSELTYIIHRYEKESVNDFWQFVTAWSSYRNSNQAVLVEENVPFLKITFPVQKYKSWDGNRLNTLEEDIYLLDSIGFQYTSDEIFDNTITIIQNNNQDSLIQLDRRAEIYASGVGLIYKEEVLLNYCANPSCIGQQEIEDGRIFIQKVRSETN